MINTLASCDLFSSRGKTSLHMIAWPILGMGMLFFLGGVTGDASMPASH
jgi:hypothetical protein